MDGLSAELSAVTCGHSQHPQWEMFSCGYSGFPGGTQATDFCRKLLQT